MRILPYNVLKMDDGRYTVYMPEHPVVGCPVWGTRTDAMTYIAERAGLSLKELREAIKDQKLALHPHTKGRNIHGTVHV